MLKGRVYTRDTFFNIFMFKEYFERGDLFGFGDIDISDIDDITKSEIIEFLFIVNDFVPPIICIEDEFGMLEILNYKVELLVIIDFLNGKFSLTGLKYLEDLNGLFFNFPRFRELKRIALEFLIIDKLKSDPLLIDYTINRLIKK